MGHVGHESQNVTHCQLCVAVNDIVAIVSALQHGVALVVILVVCLIITIAVFVIRDLVR